MKPAFFLKKENYFLKYRRAIRVVEVGWSAMPFFENQKNVLILEKRL